MPRADEKPLGGKSWAPSDDAALIQELGRGGSVEAIAATLHRSVADVRGRLDALADAATDTLVAPQNRIFPKDIAAS